ncbi:hypothetical protein AQUCO_00400585v1 [Aquilegia coerulea]|uniref:KIB1-4 beta-propeller domain-containing protein n=1 Tax=Aquilegia coerulea TaxID=218851 RepID=A0A2G5EVN0_AQUCA|nr:hypothetical protein AQUCO_00400585v1 [Aquilegia coerulea]
MSSWSNLPLELLDLIVGGLITLHDLISFGCVCSSWYLVSTPIIHRKRGSSPWLIVSKLEFFHFYSIIEERCYSIDNIPEIKDRRICSTSNGWLIMVHKNFEVQLFHPFSKKVINLPPVNDMPGSKYIACYCRFGKTFRMPGSKYIACYCRFGKTFRPCNVSEFLTANPGYSWDSFLIKAIITPDLCKHNVGKFYAISFDGDVVVIEDVDDSLPFTKLIDIRNSSDPEAKSPCRFKYYLVESSGDLLKVLRIQNSETRTMKFKVFKLDFSAFRWMELQSLGKYAFFLGSNQSFSLCTSDFPGYRGNCIYFTDDRNFGLFFLKY